MSHNFNFWGLMIATGMAFAAVIGALGWLFYNAVTKKPGEK